MIYWSIEKSWHPEAEWADRIREYTDVTFYRHPPWGVDVSTWADEVESDGYGCSIDYH